MSRYSVISVFVLFCLHSTILGQLSDTARNESVNPRFNPVSMVAVPAGLITYGILNLDDNGIYSSQDAYQDIQDAHPDFQTNVDDYLQFLPVIGVYSLNLAGIKGKHNFIDRSMIYLISVSMTGLTTDLLKRGTHRLRPDSSNYRSFPSGHASNAFVSATFLFREYRDVSIWYGIAGYSMATATGVLRMLNNKHWMSDVFVGAGVGIFITELTYFVYPVIKNFVSSRVLHKDLQAFSFSPYFAHNKIGIHMHVRF